MSVAIYSLTTLLLLLSKEVHAQIPVRGGSKQPVSEGEEKTRRTGCEEHALHLGQGTISA